MFVSLACIRFSSRAGQGAIYGGLVQVVRGRLVHFPVGMSCRRNPFRMPPASPMKRNPAARSLPLNSCRDPGSLLACVPGFYSVSIRIGPRYGDGPQRYGRVASGAVPSLRAATRLRIPLAHVHRSLQSLDAH